jgi:acetate kinase
VDSLILTLNLGSSSLKYALFEQKLGNLFLVYASKVERINSSTTANELVKEIELKLATEGISKSRILGIGCRVVHGGERLTKSTVVTDEILEEIRSLGVLAPLHNPFEADIIESCKILFPAVPIVAVFDTAFHNSLPAVALNYAIPSSIKTNFRLLRFGFHGIAHQQVSAKLRNYLASNDSSSKLINCHLGNGASVCAILDGKSIDTSMGFTPMEGLIMGTRSGDIDPGLVLYLTDTLGIPSAEVKAKLNHESGLLGLSGISGDVRILEEEVLKGNKSAEFALDCFSYRIVKYIGAYVAVLNGLDAISFSGGIGEHSALVRSKVCQKLDCFGLKFDENANIISSETDCVRISREGSPVSAWVVKANEELQIAQDVAKLLVR